MFSGKFWALTQTIWPNTAEFSTEVVLQQTKILFEKFLKACIIYGKGTDPNKVSTFGPTMTFPLSHLPFPGKIRLRFAISGVLFIRKQAGSQVKGLESNLTNTILSTRRRVNFL